MISQYNYELLGVTMLTTVVLLLLTCINHSCGTKRYNIWKMGLYLLLLNQILDIFRARILFDQLSAAGYIPYLCRLLSECGNCHDTHCHLFTAAVSMAGG